ncbi:calcineurin-binding protein 1-like isoform X3 [Carex rostrata]
MKCFLQAAELDGDDVVLWNQFGTLSCSMGSLSMARFAFEQGLRVSPTNGICMEKLMEVLIAIGDEAQCLGLAKQLLNKWPGHIRALHVKSTIEGTELGLSGFGQLEPKHPRLNFKRKSDIPNIPAERIRQDMHLQLTDLTWSALVEKTVDVLKAIDVPSLQRVIICIDRGTSNEAGDAKEESSVPGKGPQSHERCNTRSGSQKRGKVLWVPGMDRHDNFRKLEQFISKETSLNKEVDSTCSSNQFAALSLYTPELVASDIKQFIGSIPEHCNASQLGSLLLEEIADLHLNFGDYFIKLPELEQMTRQWHQDQTPRCHLYLAEVCFDLGSHPGNKMRREEFLSQSNYHTCMVMTDFLSNGGTSEDLTSFWARYCWIRGCLSLSEGDKERALGHFNSALSYLKEPFFSPNFKIEKWLTPERITLEVYSIQLDFLLKNDNRELRRLSNSQCINVLSPLLLSIKDDFKWDPDAVALEISALDLLISACEKEERLNLKMYLEAHKRKLQLLRAFSVMNKRGPCSEIVETLKSNPVERIVGVIRDISKITGLIKTSIDKSDFSTGLDVLTSLVGTIAEIQTLLLIMMRSILTQSAFNNRSVDPEQIESACIVDAACSFCKLQHLDPSASIEAQVDLIVLVHDILADCGLCCAGKDYKGEEGTFLKFAIHHLLTLDAKLKVLHGIEEAASSNEQPKDDFEESDIGTALSQSIFCLYGINMNPDSTSEGLVKHKNTGRGDYSTKEHCADLFQYILPYAKEFPKSGLIKLRRVLRAIHKHFPQPPNEMLSSNAIDKFLDGSDCCEKQLLEIYEFNGGREAIINILFPDGQRSEALEKLSSSSSEPYSEVYSNLYYFIAQAEDASAAEKYAGFVLQKEGEDFVEQNANFFKYDLLYNPLHFESWQKLANIYDEEVDLLLNDGSKCMSISDWRKQAALHQRVQAGRRRSRRCLLITLTLASTSSDESQTNELLALGYYDVLHNAVPFYDQRSLVLTKDAEWLAFCQSSMKHFEKAFALSPEWLHALYLGKLCEKLGRPSAKAFWYYSKARELKPTAVDPFYRLHASRLKLLYTHGKQSYVIQTVASYAYNESAKEAICAMLGWEKDNLDPSKCNDEMIDLPKDGGDLGLELIEKAWSVLYNDCLLALGSCVQGELKHFHKAKYKIAQGLYKRGDLGDLERARDELSFCFKSSRTSFAINMWEIDAMARKGRRKNISVSGGKINLRPSLSESSRKFVTCIRKYLLLYFNLLERTGDVCTLEQAYTHLCTDKKFSVCIGDLVPVGLGKYIQVLASAMQNAQDAASVEQLLGRMFTALMENVRLWGDIGSLPEVICPDLSEINLLGYIHQYIQVLERKLQLDQLELINEKIQKHINYPKFSNNNLIEVSKLASFSWCWCLLMKLASISAVPETAQTNHNDNRAPVSENGLILYANLQPDELLMSRPTGPAMSRGIDMNLYENLLRISNLQIRQVAEEKMKEAIKLMRSCYNFYRESICGTLPSGIHLYTVLAPPAVPTSTGQVKEPVEDAGNIDLSVPDKLLLWAYALIRGQYCNISAVVKYCEEKKLRRRKGLPGISRASPLPALRLSASNTVTNTTGIDRGEGSVDPSDAVLPMDPLEGPTTSVVANETDMTGS